jgi:hypothetical protein
MSACRHAAHVSRHGRHPKRPRHFNTLRAQHHGSLGGFKVKANLYLYIYIYVYIYIYTYTHVARGRCEGNPLRAGVGLHALCFARIAMPTQLAHGMQVPLHMHCRRTDKPLPVTRQAWQAIVGEPTNPGGRRSHASWRLACIFLSRVHSFWSLSVRGRRPSPSRSLSATSSTTRSGSKCFLA